MISAIEKGSKKQIGPHVSSRELDCKCRRNRCHWTLYCDELLILFERLRTSCGGRKIPILSGYRCPEHNEKVGGKIKGSKHMIGMALDLFPPGSMPVEEFAFRAKDAGFTTVISHPNDDFIHVHILPGG